MLIRTRLTGARYSALRCRLQSRGSLRGRPRSSDVICGIGATPPRVRPQPNHRSSTTDHLSNWLTSRTNQNRIPRPKWLIFSKRRARPVRFPTFVIDRAPRACHELRNVMGAGKPMFPGPLFGLRWMGRTPDRRHQAKRPADRDGAACGFRGQRRLSGSAQPVIISFEPSLWRLDVLRAG